MALDRKDVRAKLDPEDHERLAAICEADGVDIGEFVASIVLAAIDSRLRKHSELDDALARRGISGNNREKPGIVGSGVERRR